jgi:glycosyltransferase involved in cell wall biosynthesis
MTLEKKIKDLGLSNRVFFPGYVADARHHLHLFGVFVMPSLTEGLPMVLLEAMSARVPIVATRVGGIPKVLDDGKVGLLIEPGDTVGLKKAIISVIDDTPSAQTKVNMATQLVQESYSSRAMAEKYQKVYHELLSVK